MAGAQTRLAVVAVLGIWGCGGSPFAASDLRGNTVALRVISGDTGQPVSAAVVTVDGRDTITNGDGLAIVTAGARAEIRSADFIPRRTLAVSGDVTLWPRDDAYPDSYVRALLYQRAFQTREAALGAQARMRRVVATGVDVVPEASLWNDPAARAAHEQAASALTAATAGRVVFTVRRAATGAIAVRTIVDTSLPPGDALTDRTLRGDAIVGGRITYGSASVARSARFIAHELGHLLGLEHSVVPTDLMYFAVDRTRPASFSANESLTIRLLLQRPPGNQFPDTDPSIGD